VELTELGLARLLLLGVIVGGKTELRVVLVVEGSVEEGLDTRVTRGPYGRRVTLD
jgi:hypothetical protein